MRDLVRNQQTFYYALYTGKEDVVDTNGFKTGEKKITYSDPVKMKANISPASGYTQEAIFGKDLQYDKSMVTCDMNCPINETSVLWVDIDPYDSNGNAVPYNYKVSRVSKGIDNFAFALKRIEIRNG